MSDTKIVFHPGVAARGHLLLKRLDKKALTPGALADWKKHPHDVSVDRAPTNRATCVACGQGLVKNVLRVTFMLQCHKGYKNASHLHLSCFSKHPESAKVASIEEFKGYKALEDSELKQLKTQFENRPTKIFEEKDFKVKQEDLSEVKVEGGKRKATSEGPEVKVEEKTGERPGPKKARKKASSAA